MMDDDTKLIVWVFCAECGAVNMQETNIGCCMSCGESGGYEEYPTWEEAEQAAKDYCE